MKLTDLFIQRPVLASVVSLLILLLGLRAGAELKVREYPHLQNSAVTVTTVYVGADPDLVQGFITTPLEREIAQVEGIAYMTSSSSQGVSTINAYLGLDKNPNEALAEIANKVNTQRNQMPDGSEDSVVELNDASTVADAYLAVYSEVLAPQQVRDYLLRVIQPQLASIDGMQKVQVFGGGEYAMRVWLKADRLSAFNLTASEVAAALRANNVLAAVGESKGRNMRVPLRLNSDLHSAEDFRQMVVRSEGDTIVRLGDLADIELGADDYDSITRFNGREATFISLVSAPDANVIDVVGAATTLWPDIIRQLPEGLEGEVLYDSTVYIKDAIKEVQFTLIEAIVIVIIVIFLFLGSARSVLIPAVTVPLSMIGALFVMLVLGFSVNLLTLLAMVLAVGMVVDDAIIVLENVHRHIEEGMQPYDAAVQGARELVGPIIAMTITLVAVYVPIGFQGGLTGKLFVEFAFTLAGAVLLSGVVALTLSPMMCAKLLKPHDEDQGRLARWLDARFEALRRSYERGLHGLLDTHWVVLVFGAIVFVSCGFLFVGTARENAPEEDVGVFMALQTADAYASLSTMEQGADRYSELSRSQPETQLTFEMLGEFGSNINFIGTVLKPWSERDAQVQQVIQRIQEPASAIPAMNTALFVPPALPTAGQGFPVEFVIRTARPQEELASVAEEVFGKAMASGRFIFLDSNLKINLPQVRIEVDRNKAAALGIDMNTLGSDLSTLLSGGYVNRFSLDGRSYKVIPQLEAASRLAPGSLSGYYTRARDGTLVPLSTLVSLSQVTQPQTLNRFQQFNAVTLSGVQRPGVALGDALETLETIAAQALPPGYSVDYAGQSRQYKEEGSALLITFVFALVMIYLVLAAQFESFRDPLIMLVTVPMSICGALFFINVLGLFRTPGATLNIYTQVGLVTLIGVIAKHGILIVEFANKLQGQGMDKRLAIEEASAIRLRPVLMTTAALVISMLPLLTATGPGANARFAMGLVIASGMTIGTLFTLYVLPAVYLLIGRDQNAITARAAAKASDRAVARSTAAAPGQAH